MKAPQWKDTSTYSRDQKDRTPWCFEIRLGTERLSVSRHRDYGPDAWVMHWRGETRQLGHKAIADAQQEALHVVRAQSAVIIAAVDEML